MENEASSSTELERIQSGEIGIIETEQSEECEQQTSVQYDVSTKKYRNRHIKEQQLSDFLQQPKFIRAAKGSGPRMPSVSTAFEKPSLIGSTSGENALDQVVVELLKKTKAKQDVNWKTNPNKARAHRHLICGLHETLKHLLAENVKAVLLARNIDVELVEGASSFLYHRLRSACLDKNIPFIPCSSKKSLSKAVNKHPYIGCVGLLRYDGFEMLFNEALRLWRLSDGYRSYHLDQCSMFP